MHDRLYREGMALLEAGDAEGARQVLARAHWLAPNAFDVLHGLALAVERLGDRTRAQELLERIHHEAPTLVEPACDLARIYLTYEADGPAQTVLAPVLAEHPDHPRANLLMGEAMVRWREQHDDARAHLLRASCAPSCRDAAQALLAQLSEVTS